MAAAVQSPVLMSSSTERQALQRGEEEEEDDDHSVGAVSARLSLTDPQTYTFRRGGRQPNRAVLIVLLLLLVVVVVAAGLVASGRRAIADVISTDREPCDHSSSSSADQISRRRR